MDLFKKLNCEVGLTITALDDKFAKVFEPGSSSPEERLKALEILKNSGIRTYLFFGPLLPFISDVDLENMFKRFLDAKPDKIYIDKLNIKRGDHWKKIKFVLEKNYPEMVEKWEKVLFSKNDYYDNLKQRIKKFEDLGVKFEFCY